MRCCVVTIAIARFSFVGMALPRTKAQIYHKCIASGTISLLFCKYKRKEEKRASRKQIIFAFTFTSFETYVKSEESENARVHLHDSWRKRISTEIPKKKNAFVINFVCSRNMHQIRRKQEFRLFRFRNAICRRYRSQELAYQLSVHIFSPVPHDGCH